MLKRAAAPMRLSEVLANTTWKSLQRGEADCCVPIGVASTLLYTTAKDMGPGYCDDRKT